ncbi:MAG: TATA box-binding protein [Candidatus Aenigmatarchaeota archaeon]|nr:MAG: TATA box-binding protein [Candidatus Aenigmarchaeota archaeon]RLJ08458.1 MAG: TATA box-binding protein [Candidatus Aenigmarchaeota archaeon]
MTEIYEVSELKEWERVSAHSHIQGLGLKNGKALPEADGMIGQEEAREAAGIVVKLVKEGKFAGRSILLAGPPGTGKTALALAVAKELGKDVPFVPVTASEIYSMEMKKTEFLTQTLRKAIGVRITEVRKVYEGIVKNIDIKTEPYPYNPYQQIPVSATVTIATDKEEKKLSMDQEFALQFTQQGISEGDVVQIDADGGRVIKIGKGRDYAKKEKLDLSAAKFVPTPTGEVFKNKEFVYTLSLHQMDMIHAKQSSGDIFSLFFGEREKEIDSELRKAIDENVRKMVKEGKAEMLPGVVFIDECSLLDIETFAFLNRAMEQDLAPIIIFATNRGVTEIRGTTIKAPHGMPLDLLDRILIINTKPYSGEAIRKIIEERAKTEKINLEEKALEFLTRLGEETSLRHSIQLLAPAKEIAKSGKKEKITEKDVKRAAKLFVDVRQSVNYLSEIENRMLK